MTSTPVSLNDDSLNGSWIDINSASQIHSPIDDDSPELQRPPYSLAESVQSLGLISFQVERFLQEAQRGGNSNSSSNNNSQLNPTSNANASNEQQSQQQAPICDNISDMYLSDSDISVEGLQESKALINNLRRHHQKRQQQSQSNNNNNNNNNNDSQSFLKNMSADLFSQKLSKSGDCLLDQVSDSLSILSRASIFGETGYEQTAGFEDFDWLWDWTAQPEYFTGQEWKVSGPKQEYLMKHKQLYCSNLSNNAHENLFSGEMMSLLVLTNLISIIIGAGLTYSILMRKSST